MTNVTDGNVYAFPNATENPDDHDHEGGQKIPNTSDDDLALMRMVEAMIFASAEPVSEKSIALRLPAGTDVKHLLQKVRVAYEMRGVNLMPIGDAWAFRTADDLSFLLQKEAIESRRLSKAALEVLAIVAYHQPVTRAEIEEVRGVVTSKGTLDVLMETSWVRMRGRRKTPGRPVTYGTTAEFLNHFGLEQIKDLPGLEELKGSGLLQSQVPAAFSVPVPNDADDLEEDEDPFTPDDVEQLGLLMPGGAYDEE